MLNMPPWSQSMQRTWWPVAGTTIVIGFYTTVGQGQYFLCFIFIGALSVKICSNEKNYLCEHIKFHIRLIRFQVCALNSTPWSFTEYTLWRHQMKIFSALLVLREWNSPVTGEFPSQRPVTRSFDVFFDPRPNKRLSKQSRRLWFETSSRSLWRHCNVIWVLSMTHTWCHNM